LVKIGNNDMAFFSRQCFGNIETNAVHTAANDGNLIGKILHAALLIVRKKRTLGKA
jgi:hypothetical protein